MNKILVTGQSGSGKTTLLKRMNLDNIFYADAFVKEVLYKKGHKVYEQIISEFETLSKGDYIDTKELGQIVFNDNEKLTIVNNIVMPFVKDWLTNLKDGSIVEMAGYINMENEYKDYFSTVILITRKDRDLSKFKYMGKNTDPILGNDIEYDYIIKNDSSIEQGTTELKKYLEK